MGPTLTDPQRKTLDRVTRAFNEADKLHSRHRPQWENFFGLWFNYNEFRNSSGVKGMPRDWDSGTRNWARREFGAELFIPLIFSTLETVLPRAISNLPRMLVKPRPRAPLPMGLPLEKVEDNAENHRLLIDAQQDQIHYDLILEDIARDGFMYGIGFQKTSWRSSRRSAPRLVPHIYTGEACLEYREQAFEDPFAECIDPFDLFWDPYSDGFDLSASRPANYAIHRVWLNTEAVMQRLKDGRWNLMALTQEDIGRGGAGDRYDSVHAKRMEVSGMANAFQAGELHEVWEYHNGAEVITVLDRQFPVQHGQNPLWHGELPFQAFRPTRVTHRMVGDGEVRPIVDLQLELNTMRSQRRDAATLALIPPFLYSEGNFDPADAKWAAGALIPVQAGVDPREVLQQVQVRDIPASAAGEEQSIKGDADRTSGISDAITGADPSGGLSSTATGAQIIDSNAGKRIARKSRRLQIEIIATGCRQWIQMNQMKVLSLPPVQKPVMPTPLEPDRRYQWVKLGLGDVVGEYFAAPEGGADQADNPQQKRADATQKWNMFNGDQLIDQKWLREDVARDLGITSPARIIAPPPPPPPDEVPPAALDMLQQAGVPAELIAEAVRAAKADQQREQAQQPAQAGQQPQLPAGPQPA